MQPLQPRNYLKFQNSQVVSIDVQCICKLNINYTSQFKEKFFAYIIWIFPIK